MPREAWVTHPQAIPGNSAVRLISADGGANDDAYGTMLPTIYLRNAPYIRQVLASFAVVWSRSRLMRLAPGASVPMHADINYHWKRRVRLHFPIITHPEVSFHCGDETVHMAAGEAWLFDNWRQHEVKNPSSQERIHLVADTTGSAAFWRWALRTGAVAQPDMELRYDEHVNAQPLTERIQLSVVMAPAEVELLVAELQHELTPQSPDNETEKKLITLRILLDGLVHDWRQTFLLYADAPDGWPQFRRLRDEFNDSVQQLGSVLMMRTNRVTAQNAIWSGLIQHLLHLPEHVPTRPDAAKTRGTPAAGNATRCSSPVFIVAAPRSGSTLLFETLAVTPQLHNLGGEAHWLVEHIHELQPANGSIDSNRLIATDCNDVVAAQIKAMMLANLHDASGTPLQSAPNEFRLLEKTPKNALRIPFFNTIFPDAKFIFLWRDPRENISSIMEAWRSGKWITYRHLPGWTGPWSLLLPPGWQALKDAPLEEIAAYQWNVTNQIVMNDLEALGVNRYAVIEYSELLQHTETALARLCDFIGVSMDNALHKRVTHQLPLSRYTQTPPSADKWRANEAAIIKVLPQVQSVWQRLRNFR